MKSKARFLQAFKITCLPRAANHSSQLYPPSSPLESSCVTHTHISVALPINWVTEEGIPHGTKPCNHMNLRSQIH